MNRKELEEIVEKKTTGVQKNLEQIIISDDSEEIHKFRVSYKKLRAFTRLTSQCKPKNKPLTNLKTLYKKAGSVRDLQVYHQSIEEYFDNLGHRDSEYLKLIKLRIEHAKVQLRLMIKDFDFDSFLSRLNSCLPKKLTRRTVRKFIRKQASSIDEKLKKISSDKKIHEIRKHLKDLIYNRKTLSRVRGRHNVLLLRKKENDQMASALGDYNDNNVALNNLNASLLEDIPSDEKEILMQKIAECKRQKDALKINAIQQLYMFRRTSKK